MQRDPISALVSHRLLRVPLACCDARALLPYYRASPRLLVSIMSETPETPARTDESAPREPAVPPLAAEPPPRQPARRWLSPAAWLAIAALAVSGWHWYENRMDQRELKQELAKKLADTDTQNKESRLVAEQVREAVA